MSSTSLLLIDIRNKLISSVGIIFILVGSVGNVLNIILFRRRNLWTLSPSIPFLLVASIANMIDIYSFIILRVLIGFKISPSSYSSVACKLQLYVYYTTFCLSSWFMVGCCVDRFFSSSRSVIMRSYSSMRMTGRIILVLTIIILFMYVQVLYCYEANQVDKPAPCYVKNSLCNAFDIIYYFIFQAIGPPIFMLTFGIGIFIHIREGRQLRQELENRTSIVTFTTIRNTARNSRETLRMLTSQGILYLICSVPLLAMKIYGNITLSTVRTGVQVSIENLILNIAILTSFVDKIFSFYIYTLASKYYRKELIKLVTRYRLHRRVAVQN